MFEPEEDKIVRMIKDFIETEEPPSYVYIMLRNEHILDIRDYRKMVNSGKIKPKDAYVYIGIVSERNKSAFYYSFLEWYDIILVAYLSWLGVKSFRHSIVPATGLKYVATAIRYGDYLSIELLNLDTAVSNTNLRVIMFEVLDGKLLGRDVLTEEEYDKIYDMFNSQRLFAGHNATKAKDIVSSYYDNGNQSLAKEVARIVMDYNRIFNPYRVCYDMNNWNEVDCSTINLD